MAELPAAKPQSIPLLMAIPFRIPRFYPILDTSVAAQKNCSLTLVAHSLLDEGISILQYRHKEDWTQFQFDEAGELQELCRNAGILFVVNDRADFAHLLRAALHVGQNDLPPVAARRIIGDEVLGFSTHNRVQLTRATEEPVEYISLGPIFSTVSKLNADPVVGLDSIRKLRSLTPKPLVAIGGITLENAESVLAAGADSVAVISGLFPPVCDARSLKARAAAWLKITG